MIAFDFLLLVAAGAFGIGVMAGFSLIAVIPYSDSRENADKEN